MKTRSALSIAAAGILGLTAGHPAAAQSTIALQNGTFAGNFQSNNVNNFIGSQTYAYAYGCHYENGSVGLYVNGGSVYQFLGTTGAAGETLTLNGLVGSFNSPPPSQVLEFTTAAPTSTNDLATGSVLASETLLTPAANSFVNFAPFTFTTTAANQGIYLLLGGPDAAAYGDYGAQSNYQNFTLTDTPAAVPESSSAVPLSLGVFVLAGLLASRRSKKETLPALPN